MKLPMNLINQSIPLILVPDLVIRAETFLLNLFPEASGVLLHSNVPAIKIKSSSFDV